MYFCRNEGHSDGGQEWWQRLPSVIRRAVRLTFATFAIWWVGSYGWYTLQLSRISECGGTVMFDWGHDGAFPRRPYAPALARKLLGNQFFVPPKSVAFECRLTREAAHAVTWLTSITRATIINRCELESGAIAIMANAASLTTLELAFVNPEKTELLKLGTLTGVSYLDVYDVPAFDDDVMASMRSLHRLRHLSLACVPVTTEGLKRFGLREKVALMTVDFKDVSIDSRVFDELDRLPQLERLSVDGTQIAEDEIREFMGKHPHLVGWPNGDPQHSGVNLRAFGL